MKTQFSRTQSFRTLGNFAYFFGAAFLIASLFTNLIPPTVASAHHAIVNGSASCLSNGTYAINWSIKNWSDVNGPMTITGINRPIGVSVGTQVDVNGVTGSETLPNQSATITLTVSGSWTNGITSTNSNSVTLNGNCYPLFTNTPANTATNTPTQTPETLINTPTGTLLNTPSNTPTNTSTGTVTQTFMPTHTPTKTPEAPTNTSTYAPTNTPTDTPTNTPTNTPANTPTNTPTFTATIDPIGLTFFCTGIRITNFNDFEGSVSYAWSIAGGPSGNTAPLNPGEFEDITIDYFAGLVTVTSADQQFTASGFLPTNCNEVENTPTPPANTPGTSRPTNTPGTSRSTNTPTRRDPTEVFKTLIPASNATSEILIPVTGVDLTGGNSAQRMLFSLGISFLGLGLVLNGLSRNRKNLKI